MIWAAISNGGYWNSLLAAVSVVPGGSAACPREDLNLFTAWPKKIKEKLHEDKYHTVNVGEKQCMLNEIDSAATQKNTTPKTQQQKDVEEWQLEQHTALLLLYSKSLCSLPSVSRLDLCLLWICLWKATGLRWAKISQWMPLGSGCPVHRNSFCLDWVWPHCRVSKWCAVTGTGWI